MSKRTHFYIGVSLIITVFSIIAVYWMEKNPVDDTQKIITINQNLAKNIKALPHPPATSFHQAKTVQSVKPAHGTQPTLTRAKLDTLRRKFSRTKTTPYNSALPKEKTIILANRTIRVPDNPEIPKQLSQNQSLTQRSTIPYIIHFGRPVTEQMRHDLQKSGAIIRGYLPNYAFLTELTDGSLAQLSSNPDINYITEYTTDDKIQPFLIALTNTEKPDETIRVFIQTLDSTDVTSVAKFVEQSGGSVENSTRLSQWGVVEATISLSDAALLAKKGEVQWIEEYVEAKMLNDYAAKSEHLNAVSMWNDWYLTGNGQIVGHADTGLDTGDEATIHPDFQGQIAAIFDRSNGGSDAADYHGHGTHTAGSICGSGVASSGQYKGIAYEAKLVSQCVTDRDSDSFTGIYDLFDLYHQSYEAGATIHSDSWGADYYGYYDSRSRITDLFAWTYPDFLAVFAAGNAGADDNNNGIVDLDSLNSPGTAKNVLTVGATENDRTVASEGLRNRKYSAYPFYFTFSPIKDDYVSWSATTSPYMQGMAAFSSRGPTDDQRLKPEVVAPGTDVISTRSTLGEDTLW